MNYTTRRNGNNKVLKGFKDYLFPLIVVFIVLIFVGNYLFSGTQTPTDNAQVSPVEVSLGTPDTESYVVYSGGNKTKLEGNIQMYKGEKLQVVNGWLSLESAGDQFSLNKLGELRYNEDGTYTLYSSDLWVKSNSSTHLELRYAKVQAQAGSVFSLSQNEVASTIYVVSGVVEVQNLAGKSASLQQGEKLVIMRNSANDAASDLSLSKESIDDYIKSDDWFIKNNGNFYLTSSQETASGMLSSSGDTLGGNLVSTSQAGNSYISFSNIYDEVEIPTPTVNIEGTLLSDMVYKIDIGGQTASIDVGTQTFVLKNYKLTQRINDIVYRVYDEGNKLLSKGVITVYAVNASNTSSTNNSSTLAQVENYPITSSPLYQILTPKQNPYTTDEDIVRIEGTVPAGTVEKIVVNDFELKKFPKYGTYWSYFANSEFGNLKEGVNIYKIQYFGAEGKLVYENNFTIIKNPKPSPTPVTPPVSVETTASSQTQTGTDIQQ